MSRAVAVIVLAAGSGTRMKSKTMKVLHPLCGRSMLGHVLAAAQAMRADPTIRLAEQVQTLHQLEDGTFALETSKGDLPLALGLGLVLLGVVGVLNAIVALLQRRQKGTHEAARVALGAAP